MRPLSPSSPLPDYILDDPSIFDNDSFQQHAPGRPNALYASSSSGSTCSSLQSPASSWDVGMLSLNGTNDDTDGAVVDTVHGLSIITDPEVPSVLSSPSSNANQCFILIGETTRRAR
jgi:hypothetical protein